MARWGAVERGGRVKECRVKGADGVQRGGRQSDANLMIRMRSVRVPSS